MFERFSERARLVVVFAQDEARALKHHYIGTEHLLLGLLREEEGVAARALESLDVRIENVRRQVARIVGEGDEVTSGQIPFTPRAKRVLELSLREARSLGHDYIGTEHILLGVVRENEGVASRILLDFGADAETIRDQLLGLLSGRPAIEPDFAPESPPLAPDVVAELERLQQQKEQALEAREFERAAELRDRERRLLRAAGELTRAWRGEPESHPVGGWQSTTVARAVPERERDPQRRRSERLRRAWQAEALVVGWAMFAGAAAFGLLLGWLLWG